jgi:hypothetical protein
MFYIAYGLVFYTILLSAFLLLEALCPSAEPCRAMQCHKKFTLIF